MSKAEKIDFPRIAVAELFEVIKKVDSDHAGRAHYKLLSKIAGTGGETRGGKFALVVRALKLYGLMERQGYQEMAMTQFGNEVLKSNVVDSKKKLFQKFISIPIFNKIYVQYKGQLPPNRQGVIHLVKTAGKVNEFIAGRIVGQYYKEMDYFKSFSNYSSMESKNKSEIQDNDVEDDGPPINGNNKSLTELAPILARVFPQESEDIVEDINQLIELSKQKKLVNFSSFLEGLMVLLEGRDENEMKKELKRASAKAYEKLNNDLGH